MGKFVVFMLCVLVMLSGCGKITDTDRIKEDIISERFGENLAAKTSSFSVSEMKILKRETSGDEEKFIIRAQVTDKDETVKVTGTYVVGYINYGEETFQDGFYVTDEEVMPTVESSFSPDELLLALKFLGAGTFSELTVDDHAPELSCGEDFYTVTADNESFLLKFTYDLKLGWNIRTASLS